MDLTRRKFLKGVLGGLFGAFLTWVGAVRAEDEQPVQCELEYDELDYTDCSWYDSTETWYMTDAERREAFERWLTDEVAGELRPCWSMETDLYILETPALTREESVSYDGGYTWHHYFKNLEGTVVYIDGRPVDSNEDDEGPIIGTAKEVCEDGSVIAQIGEDCSSERDYGQCQDQTVYVDGDGGDDEQGEGTLMRPFATIARAMEAEPEQIVMWYTEDAEPSEQATETMTKGKAIWWNPWNGDDTNDGLTPETALLTPAEIDTRISPGKPLDVIVRWDGQAWRIDGTL